MSFNSLDFLAFAAVVLPLYHLLRGPPRQLFALAASYLFYAWGQWPQALVLLVVHLAAWSLALRIGAAAGEAARRRWLAAGVAFHLALLLAFRQAMPMALTLGLLDGTVPAVAAVPLGISFYTFHAIGYLVDVHRRTVAPDPSPVRVGLYLALFPHLVAGPILRARRFLPQLRRPSSATWARAGRGAELVAWGYFLKLGLADNLAPLVERRFADPAAFGALDHLTGTALFALQIYGDFAGYSLIAIGLGRILGLDFGINFRRPYFATGMADFWHRWHISLSTWLRDYLYIPLGGNRHGAVRTACNLMLTMLLGGLWHGLGATWLAWGFWHGVLLVAERRFRPVVRGAWRVPAALAVFVLAGIGWILFRSASLADAALILGRIAGLAPSEGIAGFEQMHLWRGLVAAGLVLAVDLAVEQGRLAARYRRSPACRVAGFAVLCWLILLGGGFAATEFFYFRF
ncbi:MAG: MBOAT family O-acyltransferase [Geminicoccaceae bacterium]